MDQIVLCVVGCSVHCKMFTSIRGLYPLDASSTSPVLTIKTIYKYWQIFPGGPNSLLLKYPCRHLHLVSFITEINSIQEQCSNCYVIGLLTSRDAEWEMLNYWRARKLFKVQQLIPEHLSAQGAIGAIQWNYYVGWLSKDFLTTGGICPLCIYSLILNLSTLPTGQSHNTSVIELVTPGSKRVEFSPTSNLGRDE